MDALTNRMLDALLSVNRVEVRSILFSPPANLLSPMERIEALVVPALDTIGRKWEDGEVALTQVYMAGRICEDLVEEMLPLNDENRFSKPKTAIATLEDYHTLGKRIVLSTLRASGFDLMNYGRVSVDQLVKNVINDQIRILLISVLMLPSAIRVKDVRKLLDEKQYPVRIIVGGAPFRFDPHLWQEVGADASGLSASETVGILNRLYDEVK